MHTQGLPGREVPLLAVSLHLKQGPVNPARPAAGWRSALEKTLLLTVLLSAGLAAAGVAQQPSAPGALHAATVSFDTVLADSEVVTWLQRHAFRPQAVWTTLGGRYPVPAGYL